MKATNSILVALMSATILAGCGAEQADIDSSKSANAEHTVTTDRVTITNENDHTLAVVESIPANDEAKINKRPTNNRPVVSTDTSVEAESEVTDSTTNNGNNRPIRETKPQRDEPIVVVEPEVPAVEEPTVVETQPEEPAVVETQPEEPAVVETRPVEPVVDETPVAVTEPEETRNDDDFHWDMPEAGDEVAEDTTINEDIVERAPITVQRSVVLKWDIPRARLNGDAMLINELGGYEVRYTNVTTSSEFTKVVSDPYATEVQLEDLTNGEWQFTIAAFDTNGLYSPFTQPLTQQIN